MICNFIHLCSFIISYTPYSQCFPTFSECGPQKPILFNHFVLNLKLIFYIKQICYAYPHVTILGLPVQGGGRCHRAVFLNLGSGFITARTFLYLPCRLFQLPLQNGRRGQHRCSKRQRSFLWQIFYQNFFLGSDHLTYFLVLDFQLLHVEFEPGASNTRGKPLISRPLTSVSYILVVICIQKSGIYRVDRTEKKTMKCQISRN